MDIIIEEEYGGIPNGETYLFKEDSDGDREWGILVDHFEEIFGSISDGNDAYEIPDWHYDIRSLFVHLYDAKFYNKTFIPAIVSILEQQDKPSFAQFECFDPNFESDEFPTGSVGCFMVFPDCVHFNKQSDETGLIQKLI